MKLVRIEKQTTPIGQQIEVHWFSGTPEEVEKELRSLYGSIVILNGSWHWTVQASLSDLGGELRLFGTDDPSETIADSIQGDEESKEWKEYLATHTRHFKVGSLSEVFMGDIEFSPVGTY